MQTDWRLMQRFWKFVTPHQQWLWIFAILLPIATVCQVAGPVIIQRAIDTHLLVGDRGALARDAALLLAVLLGEYVTRAGERFSLIRCGILTLRDVRRALMAHVTAQPMQLFEHKPLGALVSRVTSDVESLMDTLSTGVITIISDCITLLGITAVMYWLSPRLTVVTLGVALPVGVLLNIARVRLRAYYHRSRQHTARMNGILNEAVTGIRELQLFNFQHPMQARFRDANGHFFRDQMRIVAFEAGLFSVVEGAGIFTIGVMAWYGAQLILAGEITIGILVAFITFIQRFYSPIKELSNKITVLQGGLAALDRIMSLLDRDERMTWGAHATAPAAPTVAFDHVSFIYPQRLEEWRQHEVSADVTPAIEDSEDDPLHVATVLPPVADVPPDIPQAEHGLYALRDVSLRVDAGERVAIVGWTGSGKSTMIKLLAGMYRQLRGEITVGALPLAAYTHEVIQHHIGVVHQEVQLFADTIWFNIGLGAPGITQAQMIEACRIVQADRFIRHLPQGYDTVLNASGSNLSHGQRQLLAFARVLAWSPHIVVLDEATSSVDAHSEQLIRVAILKVMERTTTIVIAHRLATIMQVDRIVVLHEGRVVEEGTHAELLAQRGHYYALYEVQFAAQTVG